MAEQAPSFPGEMYVDDRQKLAVFDTDTLFAGMETEKTHTGLDAVSRHEDRNNWAPFACMETEKKTYNSEMARHLQA